MQGRIVSVVLALSVLVGAAKAEAKPGQSTLTTSGEAVPTCESCVMFIENIGQFADETRFRIWNGEHTMWLAEDAIWITLLQPEARRSWSPVENELDALFEPNIVARELALKVNLKLSFPGANPHPRLEPLNQLETQVSYFIGNNPAHWYTDVPVWAGVRYEELYPGVDLELLGRCGGIAQRLVVRPGADLSKVRLRLEGADALSLDGDLMRITTAAGSVLWPLLQLTATEGQPPTLPGGGPVLSASEVTAPFASRSPWAPAGCSKEPVLADNPSDLLYSTFLGASGGDEGYGIALDGAGRAYVAGSTSSSDFPSRPGTFAQSDVDHEVFMVKLNPAGNGISDLLYVAFLGGSSNDYARELAVGGGGALYLTGSTKSADFPTTAGAFDADHNGGTDAFVAMLNPATGGPSDLLYSTFLGGDGGDGGERMALGEDGAVYVTGRTGCSGFPTSQGAFDTTRTEHSKFFLAKLNLAGTGSSDLLYSTFLDTEEINDVAAHGGAVYLTGRVGHAGFPATPGAYDETYNGDDAIMVKINPAGHGIGDLLYSTFLGGDTPAIIDSGSAIAVDDGGVAYIAGTTFASDFPTTSGAFDTSNPGDAGFVVKLNPGGNGVDDLLYSTFLGSYAGVGPTAIAVGRTGLTYVMGYSESPDFPTTPDAFDRSYNSPDYPDGVVAKLNLVGGGRSDLLYSTFLGGSDVDLVRGAVVDKNGSVYVTGRTDSSDLPTSRGAYDAAHNGSLDAFMAKLATGGEPTARTPVVVVPGYRSTICLPYTQSGDQCVWMPGPAESIYLPLKEAFEQAGYREGEDFYYCKYKWWRSSSGMAETYLHSCIDRALADNPGAESVHIITHSSGGNVARAYIQADGPSRVDRLLMIAPPTKGAVGIYWPWEGGDLSREDRVSRVAYDLALFLLSRGSEPLDQVLRFGLFHQSMPCLGELVPVEQPFLYDLSSEQVLDPAGLVFANGFLPHLNANLDALFNDVSKVVVYAGSGHDTLEWIDVRSHDPNLDGERWLDGRPVGVPRFGDGDGTILLSRSGLPAAASWRYEWRPFYRQDHWGLISEVIPDILRELALPEASPTGLDSADLDWDQDLLFIAAKTPARVVVTDPQGRQTGYRSDGQLVNEIPGAEYLGEEGSDKKIIVIPTPVLNGHYEIQVSGTNISRPKDYAIGAFSYAAGGALSITGGEVDPGEIISEPIIYRPYQLFLPALLKGARSSPAQLAQ